MLSNYKKLDNGLITQIEKDPRTYNFEYVNTYNKLGESGKRMSFLRLGLLIGAIDFVPKKLLDVGCGNGDFLNVAKEYIEECIGSDTDYHHSLPENVKFIKSDRIYDDEYDVVCFFDVLEHFENIYDIKQLKTKYIIISLPNCEYQSDEWFENWKHRKPNEHFWFFNQKTLINFFDEIGYDCIKTCYIEDIIRKDDNNKPNILSGVFKKRTWQ